MSEDIVVRLRSWRHDSWPADPSLEAAAEIERLRERVARLEGLLAVERLDGLLADARRRWLFADEIERLSSEAQRLRAALETQP